MDTKRLHVLTGAPGTGKTSVLADIGAEVHVVGEPAREVIAEQRASGGTGTSEQDAALFVELLLRRSIEKHIAALDLPGPVVFDRGMPDCVAYAVLLDVDQVPGRAAADAYRYHPQVLILPPWEEIYTKDDERTMAFEDTIPFHEALVDAYAGAGYGLVEVPKESRERRAAFVRELVSRRS